MTKQTDVLDSPNYRPVLNHGFVGLIDKMGTDSSIVQAARVSYGAGTKTVNEDRGLIRYLLRNHHTTPFEMVELKFHVRAPIFVIRQWFRHRTASVNEESARYSEMTDEFYLPESEFIQPQSKNNKQGRAGVLSDQDRKGVLWVMDAAYEHAHQSYKVLLGDRSGDANGEHFLDAFSYEDGREGLDPLFSDEFNGTARELARAVMPVGAYSEFYWKLNLHNLFNFLRLRADNHAQYEIRVFAEAIIDLVKPLFPVAMEAFEDYVRDSVTLSRMERELLIDLLASAVEQSPVGLLCDWIAAAGGEAAFAKSRGMSKREFTDFRARFKLIPAE